MYKARSTPFISLAISLGAFFFPLLLAKVFQTGIMNKILSLFPINHYQVEEMLSKMQANTGFFFSNFTSNIIFTTCTLVIAMIIADLILYVKMKHYQVK